jgi:Fur family ferric uptake transcriptional regulator
VEPKELREAGLKVTLPRLKILEMLEHSATKHLSAEEIYRRLLDQGEDIGLATVYRVLTQFEAAGLVIRHHFEGGHAVFEMQQPAHHDHIVCMRCGRVDEFVDEVIEKRQREKAKELGYKLTEHSLIMYGQCLKGDSCPNLKKK